jgi:hypothetical protein
MYPALEESETPADPNLELDKEDELTLIVFVAYVNLFTVATGAFELVCPPPQK